MKKSFLLTLVLMLGLMLFVGCKTDNSTDDPSETIKHTVTFYVDGVQYGEKVEVEDGKKVSAPTAPVKAEDDANSYEFAYWHLGGVETSFNFNTSIKEDTKLYAKFNVTAKVYDFIAYIWLGDGETYHITTDEANSMKETILASEALAGKKALVYLVDNRTRDGFVSDVINNGKVDFVIGGANLSAKDKEEGRDYLDIDTTESENPGHLIKLASGWCASATRYMGVLNTSTHQEIALAIYNIFTEIGPDYATFSAMSVTLKSGASETITVENATKEVVWSSSDSSVTTVENGVITGVSEGTCQVYATVGAIKYAIDVVIDNTDYGLVVWVNGMSDARITEAESERMYNYVREIIPAEKAIRWEYFAIAEKTFVLNAQSAKVDIVISSSNLSGSTSFGDDRKITFDEAGPKTRVGGVASNNGWVANTSRYIGIASQVDSDHYEYAKAAFALLTHVGPDHIISTNQTEMILEVGQESKFEVSAFGTVTFESSNPEYVTVDENGMVRGIKETTENIKVTATDANNNKVQITVTVTAQPIVPTYDLYVWINLRTDKNWMSEADLARLREAAKVEGKNIVIEVRTESKVADLVTAQSAQSATERVDVVLGRSALGTSTGTYKDDIADGTVKQYTFDASWGYDTGYVYVMSDVHESHTDLVDSFVNLVTNKVPGYFQLTTDNYAVSTTDGSFALEAIENVTYTSSDETVVTVSGTTATIVGEGSATITATRQLYSVAISVTVSAPVVVPYDLVVYVNSKIVGSDIKTLYDNLTDKDEYCTLVIVQGAESKVAASSKEVDDYNKANPTNQIAVVIGHTQMTSGHENGLTGDSTLYSYSFYETRYNVKSDLAGGATNYYMAIISSVSGSAYAEAIKLANLIKAA